MTFQVNDIVQHRDSYMSSRPARYRVTWIDEMGSYMSLRLVTRSGEWARNGREHMALQGLYEIVSGAPKGDADSRKPDGSESITSPAFTQGGKDASN